ncbi:MAG: type II toxin-antitoxin system VapC family toxin [Candidatus Freyarchaeota archaeon]|nr:type II toxin-antitoxin system VapC family toxin [Candidatus Jordarchaeia archaeon]
MPQRKVDAVLCTSLNLLLRKLCRGAASLLPRLLILDLTNYELGNIVRKEYRLGHVKNWESVMERWAKIIGELPTYSVEVEHLREVEKIAVERELLFYDATYIYVAEKLNLKLITEDEEILNKCKNSIALDKFLKQS